jgi:hypothetical protein
MNLYCACGYPFLVTAVWDGNQYYLVLRDGRLGKASPPIIYCPQCGRGLVLEKMVQPYSNILNWRPRSHLEPDTERTG